jgi:hypothetical protein
MRLGGGEAFAHDQLGAAAGAALNVEFVHEGAHEKNAAAGGAQEIFFGEGVGNIGEAETLAFVEDVDDELALFELDGHDDFAAALLTIAVTVGVNDRFADGHADFVAIVFVEAGFAGDTQDNFLGEIDAIQERLEGDFNALSVLGHPSRVLKQKRAILARPPSQVNWGLAAIYRSVSRREAP